MQPNPELNQIGHSQLASKQKLQLLTQSISNISHQLWTPIWP